MKTKHLLLFLLLAALCPWTAMAQKTHIANTSTSTTMTWDEFASIVNNGTTYQGMTVYLDEDITATTMAGTDENNCFQGTFEGNSHTLTFNYSATAWYTAPFRYLNRATIQNLKVSGTITANAARSAGLAGACYGNTTITNCLSDITINSSISGDGTYGGFVSMVREGTTTFEGCTFTGRLLGSGTYRSGGLTGCTISTVVFNNCVFDPTEITIGLDNSASFSREFPDSNAVINVNNCYYTYTFNDGTNYVNQGKQRYTITGQIPVSAELNGTATNHGVSHITTYSDNPGLLYNDTIIAGEGEQVSLNLSGSDNIYIVDHGTLTGSANPYTLTMTANNTEIRSIKTHIASTATATAMTWDEFAFNVSHGVTYEGETVYLDDHVTATTMAGTNENNCFKGTFDGQVHTLTFNYTATAWYTAPFCYLNGATIKDLKVSGTITTDVARCAGFAGHCYGDNNFINCMSNITINSTLTDAGFYGGFVSVVRTGTTTFEGCTFTGKLLGSTHRCGGFVGSTVTAVVFNNCVFTPRQITIGNDNSASFSTTYDDNAVITVNNSYFTTDFNDGTNYVNQGKQRYTVTGQNPVSVAMNGTATNHNVSHITAYNGTPGLLYNDTIFASSDEQVSLNLGVCDDYLVDHGTLTGTANPYTLTMEAYNTVISATPLYSVDFENGCDGWEFNNGDRTNQWCYGTAAHNGEGTYGIYISKDNGETNTYYERSSGTVFVVKTFDLDADAYNFSYDWRESARNGRFRVFLVPATETFIPSNSMPDYLSTPSNLPIGWIALDGGMWLTDASAQWQTESQDVRVPSAGSWKMVFVWYNFSTLLPIGRPAAFDNVRITRINACKPTNLQCTTDGNTATLSWTENNSDVDQWQICLNGDESNLITVTDNPHTLTNLTLDATYTAKVRSITNYGVTRWSDEISFTPITGLVPTNLQCTTVGNTATLSWTENNSDVDEWQICLNGDESNPIAVTDNPHTLTNLTLDVTYTAKVRSITSYGATGWSDEVSFTPSAGYPPTDLQCTIANNIATLSWTENNSDVDHWEICLNGDESNLITVTDNPHTLTTLATNATYTAKVRSITNYGATRWSNEISFTIIATTPYSTDFEGTSCDWLFDFMTDGDRVNRWVWGTAANNDGTHSLYVSHNGTDYQYTQYGNLGVTYSMYTYKYFWLEEGVYHVSFDWKGLGVWISNTGEMIDYLQVSLNSNSQPSMGGLYTSSPLGQQEDWTTMDFEVNIPSAGTYQLVFRWCCTLIVGNLETIYPAAIDNVSITQVGGFAPTDLQCTAASNTQATLGWTENNSDATDWQICLNGDENNLIAASTNPFTLTNLTTDATYTAKVRSITPDGASAWSDEISFVPTIKTVIGTGTETIIALPCANHFTSVTTQQIYTADELGAAGDILSIEFYKTGTTTCTRNLDIYMAHTTKNKYTNANDWVYISDALLVFSGMVSFADDAWTTITLDTPFPYDGQQNLAITVHDHTGSTGATAGFLSFTVPEKQAIAMDEELNTYLVPYKNQIRMLKSAVHTAVTGYGTGTGNWSLVASPLAGEVNPVYYSNMIWNSFDLYRFNPSASMEWENWKQEGDHYHFNLESGRGYLYANSENVTLVFSGVPYSGNGQVTLSKDDNAPLGQWNLIGNPLSTNATLGTKPFYIMNEYGTEIIAADNDHRVIAPMQGIFVEANEEGEIVTFTAQARGGESANESIVLNLSQGGPSTGSGTSVIDRAIVRFGEGEALHKLQIRDNSPKVYIPQDGKDYAIVRSNGQGEIPINFEAAEDGIYTLTVDAKGLEMEYLHLIDNMTGTDIDLLATPYYTFEARYSDYASRFKLVFATNEEDGPSTGSGTFAYYDGSVWVIGNPSTSSGAATLQLIDMLGHVLRSETIDGNATISTSGLGAGVYIMRLVNGESVKVQKVVVRL